MKLARKMQIQVHLQPTGLRPTAMLATLKTLFNALSFANVNNLGEFRTMLREVDAPAEKNRQPTREVSEHAPAVVRIYPAA